MIRRVQMNINYSNQVKLDILDSIFIESKIVINKFITELWNQKDFSSKFISFKVDTWFSARMQQCLGKQALEIVKSQRKKKKKSKPLFNSNVINLDSRFIDIQFDNNTFDTWFKINSIGNKINLKLPSKKHIHFNKFKKWTLKKSIRLRKNESGFFIDLYFQKEKPIIKLKGKNIGIDIGYKKLLIDSNGKKYDTGVEIVYNKISRKKQGSKSFKRSLVERNNKINESINKIKFKIIRSITAEDLKNVKHKSKGKIRKQFNNKLQRWSYSKVLNKLSLRCEEQGIDFVKINPV